MRLLPLLSAAALAAGSSLFPSLASAGAFADVSVHDRRDGRELTVYRHQGRRYVVGQPGREYEIRVRNHGDRRVLAVTSVDGINVLSGQTASPDQSGYVVDPQGQVRIEGWRKNLSEVARFYFTRLPDSYAARTGRPDQVGVIGVALFGERRALPPPCCHRRHEGADRDDAASQPAPAAEPRAAAEGAAPSAKASASAEAAVGDRTPREARRSPRLGTGHGGRLDSAAQYVEFERASTRPDEVIAIWYDSRANLVAQGVIPPPRRDLAQRRPDPFPAGGFVPDP